MVFVEPASSGDAPDESGKPPAWSRSAAPPARAILGHGFVDEAEPNGTSATATPVAGTNAAILALLVATAALMIVRQRATMHC